MRKLILGLIAGLSLSLSSALAQDSDQASPSQEAPAVTLLSPQQVLDISANSFPDILASVAQANAARGDQQAALGAFDLVFEADWFDRASGTFSGSVGEVGVTQNLRPFGATVYSSYRKSEGTFPIYENINFTNNGGEFKVGALFSLLRNRSIDGRRFNITDTRLARQQADLEVTLTKVGVQQKALNAYWRWVAAGAELKVYRDLLQIADAREIGLEEQVAKGALPAIAVTENLQNIYRRQTLVKQAERNYAVAANGLSFYLRDGYGDLVLPSFDALPSVGMLPDLVSAVQNGNFEIADVLMDRPELQQLRVGIERARNKVALSENELRPQLDFNLEVSRDVGAIAEGGPTFDSTDTIVGFTFSVPLQRREARGKIQRAQSELRAARLRERQLQDAIEVELSDILINLETALSLRGLANQEVVQAETMVEAERRRFELGASDFFLVNVREERAADAKIAAIRAELNGRLARTSFDAATINLPALGLQ